jgi:hypothetical protein
MWDIIPQPGLASAVLDFTDNLSLLLVGLVGLVWLSVGMIVFMALRYYLSQKTELVTETKASFTDRRDAA